MRAVRGVVYRSVHGTIKLLHLPLNSSMGRVEIEVTFTSGHISYTPEEGAEGETSISEFLGRGVVTVKKLVP